MVEIVPARAADRMSILAVMEHWNMHQVPSPEMGELDLGCFFVGLDHSRVVVGAGGYRLLGDGQGKTTLLGVLPEHAGAGLGARLQDTRLEAMAAAGVHTVTTNADRPATIEWYQRHYGYERVGTLAKEHEFSLPEVDHWTTLQLDLRRWMSERGGRSPAPRLRAV